MSGIVADTEVLLRIAHDAAEEGNFEHARHCYEQGAALGDAMCLQALGYMYDVGEGVAQNRVLAMRLYRRAWVRGSHIAALNIAGIYRDLGKARLMFQWFKRVAAVGDGSAQLELAKCYLAGIGVRKDVHAAIRCARIAIDSDYITEYEREEAQALLSTFGLKLCE